MTELNPTPAVRPVPDLLPELRAIRRDAWRVFPTAREEPIARHLAAVEEALAAGGPSTAAAFLVLARGVVEEELLARPSPSGVALLLAVERVRLALEWRAEGLR